MPDVLASWSRWQQEAVQVWEEVQAFRGAVHWDEDRWVWGILGFHVVMAAVVYKTRKRFHVQFLLLCFMCALVVGMDAINRVCHTHWRAFASQDYFQPDGLFLTVVASLPLLSLSFALLLHSIVHTVEVLIQVKRTQLKPKQE